MVVHASRLLLPVFKDHFVLNILFLPCQLRAVIAPCIESLIVLDRLLYIQEQVMNSIYVPLST